MSHRLLELGMDILFPQRCAFCDAVLGFSGPCTACAVPVSAALRPAGVPVPHHGRVMDALEDVWAAYYYEEPVKGAVLRMKFEDRPDIARPLAQQLTAAVRGEVQALNAAGLVPVAPDIKGINSRGYDVPLLLARALSRELGLPVMPVLCKTRKTPRQVTLSGEERRRNLTGAFTVRPKAFVQGKRFFLVDDVFTTGSTLNECAKALHAAGAAECFGLCVAATR